MRANRQSIIWLVALMLMWTVGPASAEVATLGRIRIESFIRMHAMKAVLVLDVRGTDAYRAGHIPGAVHVPLDHIAARAEELQALVRNRMVVAYCSCPEEHSSLAAVKLLDANGIPNAAALVGGLPAWVSKGGRTDKYRHEGRFMSALVTPRILLPHADR